MVWIKKGTKINWPYFLRGARIRRRKYFTAGNGHHSGETPGRGRSRETGVFGGWLAPAGGPQCRENRATGRLRAARPDKAPPTSYVEGALSHSSPPPPVFPDPHTRIPPRPLPAQHPP